MLIRFKYLLLLIIWCLGCTLPLISQELQMFRGKIMDGKNMPVAGANVMLYEEKKSHMMAFAITDNDGGFTLKIGHSENLIYILVTHLSFSSKKYYITDIKKMTVIDLEPQEYRLPDVVIKPKKYERSGDTLSYYFNDIKKTSDKNIEQVLSRIPGITIEQGQIRYMGLSISKFYIEGLDMLEGRYQIATKNIHPDAVKSVDILEHHQPIKALDSIIKPDNAAINLRLKNGIAMTGSAVVGTGANPLLYNGSAHLFGFLKKFQFVAFGAVNNIGAHNNDLFQNKYDPFQFQLPPLSISGIGVPLFLDPMIYAKNNEKVVGANYLRKIGANGQMKLHFGLTDDHQTIFGSNRFMIFDQNATIVRNEDIVNTYQPRYFHQDLMYEHNAKKVYLKATLRAKFENKTGIVDNVINSISTHENVESKNQDVTGNFVSVFRHKNKAYQINGDFKYVLQNHILGVTPNRISIENFLLSDYPVVRQNYDMTSYTYKMYADFHYKKNNLQRSYQWKISQDVYRINTGLKLSNDSTKLVDAGINFTNDYVQNNRVIFFDQSYVLTFDKHTYKIYLPGSIHFFSLEDHIREKKINQSIPVFKLYTGYSYKIKSSAVLGAGYTFRKDYDNVFTRYNEGYILRTPSNLAQGNPNLNQYTEHIISVDYRGYEPESNLEIQLSSEYFYTINSLISRADFTANGANQQLISGSNIVKGIRTKMQFSLPFITDLSLKFKPSHTISTSTQIYNKIYLNITNQSVNLDLTLDYILSNSVLSLKPSYVYIFNNLSKNGLHQYDIGLGYYYKIKEDISLKLSYNQYIITTIEKKILNEMVSFEYNQKFNKFRGELIIRWSNITNNPHFISFTQNFNLDNFSYLAIRPSQIYIQINKKF